MKENQQLAHPAKLDSSQLTLLDYQELTSTRIYWNWLEVI